MTPSKVHQSSSRHCTNFRMLFEALSQEEVTCKNDIKQ